MFVAYYYMMPFIIDFNRRLIRFDVDESTFSQAPLILTPTTHVNKKTFTGIVLNKMQLTTRITKTGILNLIRNAEKAYQQRSCIATVPG